MMVLMRPRSRGVRCLFALFLAIAASMFVSVASQHRALADTGCAPVPVKQTFGTETEWTYTFQTVHTCTSVHLEKSHTCMVMGTAYGVQAIQCADVYVNIDENLVTPQIEVYGVGTYYCQNSVGRVYCTEIIIHQLLGYTLQAGNGNGKPYGSRADTGAGEVVFSSEHLLVDYPDCLEAWGADGPGNVIYVPSNGGQPPTVSQPVGDSGIYSGAHVNVCFTPVPGGGIGG